jgi:hypothetical protein
MDRISDIHGEISRSDAFTLRHIHNGNRRRRRASRYQPVIDDTQAAPETLTRNTRIINASILELLGRKCGDWNRNPRARSSNVANHIRAGVVENNAFFIRALRYDTL